jgi:hypothetical protein
MGTLAEIRVYHSDAEVAARAITDSLDGMQGVDRLLNSYPTVRDAARQRAVDLRRLREVRAG